MRIKFNSLLYKTNRFHVAVGLFSNREHVRTATGGEYFARQDSGLSQIFKLRVSNSEKILSDINVVV